MNSRSTNKPQGKFNKNYDVSIITQRQQTTVDLVPPTIS